MDNDTPHTLHAGRYLHLAERNGWEYATRPNATGVVAIVAVTDGGELVLVRQHRPVVGRDVLELPAGLVGDDGDSEESRLTAAKRELEEETGFAASTWRRMLTAYPSAGLTDEAVTFFHATGLTRSAPAAASRTRTSPSNLCRSAGSPLASPKRRRRASGST